MVKCEIVLIRVLNLILKAILTEKVQHPCLLSYKKIVFFKILLIFKGNGWYLEKISVKESGRPHEENNFYCGK